MITKKHQIKNTAVNLNKMKEKINDVYRRKLFGNFPKMKKKNTVNVHMKMHYLDGCVDIHLACVYFCFVFV